MSRSIKPIDVINMLDSFVKSTDLQIEQFDKILKICPNNTEIERLYSARLEGLIIGYTNMANSIEAAKNALIIRESLSSLLEESPNKSTLH